LRNWRVIETETGAVSFVTTEDGQTPAGSGYTAASHTWTEMQEEPTDADSIKESVKFDAGVAQEWARAEIAKRVAAAIADQVPEPAYEAFILAAWSEVQVFKMMLDIKAKSGIDLVPDALDEQQRRFPHVMAVSHLAGVAPFDVATILETRYWDRVKAIALSRATLIIAYDQVAETADPADMVDIATQTDVAPTGMANG